MLVRYILGLLIIWILFVTHSSANVNINIKFPEIGIKPEQLAVIVNERDKVSADTAFYYQQLRGIPKENIIRVSFNPAKSMMTPADFAVIKGQVAAKLPNGIQVLALAWLAPYRVGCMSITSAFTLGYDVKYCSEGCKKTAKSPYVDSGSKKPFDEHNIRLSMMLAAKNLKEAENLIDRGIAADHSEPFYPLTLLVETPDQRRNVRKYFFPYIEQQFSAMLAIENLKARDLIGYKNVMFYFTGDQEVQYLSSNKFLPGAVGDHLTSLGGMLTDSPQMSAIEWLEAGATGSYGSVVEPCNYTEKFPNPEILIRQYLKGFSLIEAYWQSVAMPGQGVFIGEPLAAPFRFYKVNDIGKYYEILSPMLTEEYYRILIKNKHNDKYKVLIENIPRSQYNRSITIPKPLDLKRAYKIEAMKKFN